MYIFEMIFFLLWTLQNKKHFLMFSPIFDKI